MLILGAGYAGLNAYYRLRQSKMNSCRVRIISSGDEFVLHTGRMRSLLISGGKYTFRLPEFVGREEVKDIDLNSRVVFTSEGREEPDALIVALGCRREGLDDLLLKATKMDRVSVGAEDEYDEYIALQLAFYLKASGRDVEYSGGFMGWLGVNVERTIQTLCEEMGIRTAEVGEKGEDRGAIIIPRARPPKPLDTFLRVDERLRVADSVFAVGDVASFGPKLGEMAMRMGVYAAEDIVETARSPFRPMFISIIDTGKGRGIHIRSDVPWGGSLQSVKVSRLRSMMKRFLESYYIHRKGKMGLLIRF